MKIVAACAVGILLFGGLVLMAIGFPLVLDYLLTRDVLERMLFGAPVTAAGLACIAGALAIVIWWPRRG